MQNEKLKMKTMARAGRFLILHFKKSIS